jgi:hypothetical protein
MRSTEIYSTATERLVLLNAHNNKCGRDLSRDSRVVIRDRHRIEGALGCVFLLAFWRKQVRNANGESSSWKSAANKTHM